MAIEERKTSINANNNIIQNIVLENREKLSISGVLDVLSFDDQIVILETELGLLTIKGENLRINKLSLDTRNSLFITICILYSILNKKVFLTYFV